MHIKQAAFLTGVASTVFITNAQEIGESISYHEQIMFAKCLT
jgi:hypothetical protein